MNPIFMMCNDVPWCYFPETPGRTPSIQSKNTRLRSLAGKHAPSSKWLQQVFNRSVPRQNDVPQKQQRIKWVKWKGETKIHLELMNWKYSMALHFQNLNVCNNIGSLYAPRRMQYNAECWECLQLPDMSPRSFWGDDSSKNTSTNTTLTTLIQCNPKCFTKTRSQNASKYSKHCHCMPLGAAPVWRCVVPQRGSGHDHDCVPGRWFIWFMKKHL